MVSQSRTEGALVWYKKNRIPSPSRSLRRRSSGIIPDLVDLLPLLKMPDGAKRAGRLCAGGVALPTIRGRRLARSAAIKADGRLDVVGEETIVTLVHKRKASAADALCLDLARVGPEISPRIYGQFIEHLDRCIYGGVWAEMLKDRKFLRPVGHDWQTVNPDPAAFQAILDPGSPSRSEQHTSE